MTETATRENGIEFRDLRERLGALTYPVTGRAVIAAQGDARLAFADGDVTVRDALEPCADTTFVSPADVVETLFGMVPMGAIGRKRYTDRGCLAADPTPVTF